MQSSYFSAGALSLLIIGSGHAKADVVSDWNRTLLQAIRTDSTPPPRASRAMAMMHLSVYDSVNSINPTHRPYLNHPAPPAGASPDAAACAAAKIVLDDLYAANAAVLSQIALSYTTTLATIPNGAGKDSGITWGTQRGQAMLDFRDGDGSDLPGSYTNTTEVGKWRPTLPAFRSAAFPQWGHLSSFAIPRNDLFRPQPPPVLSSSAYALEWRWVKEIGGSDSTLRTADESEIANFWADGGGTETPPGHWLNIAEDVSNQQGLGMQDRARLFALVSLTTADAAIVAWDAKYVYDLWRPITAIREADSDGNASTTSDPTWLPFISTPPFPEYVSGHSTFSRSAATVMAAFFGTDEVPFTTGSDALPGVLRSYPGFAAAADEAGVSRIYGGIHFASGNIAGQASAFGLGTLVANNFLAPLTDTEFSIVRHSPDGLQLEVQVTNGATYRIEASSDMRSWETLTTITAGGPTISFLDVNAPAGKRFYRLVELP